VFFLRVSNEAFSSGKVVAYLLSSNFFHFLIIILLILFIVFLFYILFLLFTKIKVNIIKVSLLFFFLAAGFHFSSPIVQNLKQYQKSRITSFINPYSDLRGRGWHIIQSRIAVGSGGISGKGFLKGTQNKLNFLPERHTDFIFSLISEEFGFVGSFLVLFLEFLLLLFLYYTAIKSTSTLGFYISISTFILFLIHIFANIGMNLGVMPVIGMPLPFVSYGGSFYIVASILLGINVNIYSQQKNINKIGIFFNEENRR
jgi:rod shape determining protein RodA